MKDDRIELPGGGYAKHYGGHEPDLYDVFLPDGMLFASAVSGELVRYFALRATPAVDGAPADPLRALFDEDAKVGLQCPASVDAASWGAGVQSGWDNCVRRFLRMASIAAQEAQHAAPEPPASPAVPVTLTYTNWEGVTEERTITPTGRMVFMSNEWHPEPQWLLEASGDEFDGLRLFALTGFGQPASPAEAPRMGSGVDVLQVENERLRKALKPFATACDDYDDLSRDTDDIWESAASMSLSVGDLRRARAALATRPATPPQDDHYLVWSNEHRSWWGPNNCGYTRRLEKAGRYTRSEAIAISKDARGGWQAGEVPPEMPVRVDDAISLQGTEQ